MKHKLLMHLAKKKCLYSEIEVSTKKIAKEINASQQSVSRLLIKLEDEGYIKREVSHAGITICMKKKGRKFLEGEYALLKEVLTPKTKLKGKIFQGVGEGSYYVKKYQGRIIKKLGFVPYPGTLNMKVKKFDANAFLANLKRIRVNGFSEKSRTFGDVELFRVIVGGVEAALIRPVRSLYDESVIELIGPSCFRTALNLHEGDSLIVYQHEK